MWFKKQDGCVEETGTHAELIQRQGHYSEMWLRQAETVSATASAASLAELPVSSTAL